MNPRPPVTKMFLPSRLMVLVSVVSDTAKGPAMQHNRCTNCNRNRNFELLRVFCAQCSDRGRRQFEVASRTAIGACLGQVATRAPTRSLCNHGVTTHPFLWYVVNHSWLISLLAPPTDEPITSPLPSLSSEPLGQKTWEAS